jgi:hexulose-6-phosphate isomerase
MTISRRHFLGAAAATASAGFFHHTLQAQESVRVDTFPSELYKARILKVPTNEDCAALKAAGFEGVEVQNWKVTVDEARKSRLIAEKHGVRIHSVMFGWANFNQSNNYDADIESVKTALRAAAGYGADTILLVPCRIGGFPNPKIGKSEQGLNMPVAWDFDIDFDPKTLKVKTVAAGDNAPYTDEIAAQNTATEASIRAIESLIPTAAKEGVRIAIENVWNNLWSTPKFFAAFCKYFDHPWVGCYFDLGNHTMYARCEEWVKELGNSIIKLHIKGFNVTEVTGKLGGGPGDWSKIDQASIDWKSVRKLLAKNGYSGWITTEEDEKRETDADYSKVLDSVIAM